MKLGGTKKPAAMKIGGAASSASIPATRKKASDTTTSLSANSATDPHAAPKVPKSATTACGVAVRGAVEAVSRELKEGGTVCVFLEGTSSGGDSVKPFKPSLVQAAIDADAPLAPVAIRYRPFESGVVVAEEVAYWKDHVFGPHCWRLLGLRGALAEVTCGPVIHSRAADRKGLAELAHQHVSDLLKVAA